MSGLTTLFLKANKEDQAVIMWILMLEREKQTEIVKQLSKYESDGEKVKAIKELYFQNMEK